MINKKKYAADVIWVGKPHKEKLLRIIANHSMCNIKLKEDDEVNPVLEDDLKALTDIDQRIVDEAEELLRSLFFNGDLQKLGIHEIKRKIVTIMHKIYVEEKMIH